MTWKQIKQQRAIRIGGWYCENCHRYLGDKGRYAIGHHIDHNRKNNTLENCFLRCVSCEQADPHTYQIDTGD